MACFLVASGVVRFYGGKGEDLGCALIGAVGMGNSLGGAFPPRSVPGKLVAPSWTLEASVSPAAVSPAATSAQTRFGRAHT